MFGHRGDKMSISVGKGLGSGQTPWCAYEMLCLLTNKACTVKTDENRFLKIITSSGMKSGNFLFFILNIGTSAR